MKKKDQQFYLVDLKILPEAIKKTIRVKEMLQDGTCGSINEAVNEAVKKWISAEVHIINIKTMLPLHLKQKKIR